MIFLHLQPRRNIIACSVAFGQTNFFDIAVLEKSSADLLQASATHGVHQKILR
jgi:hypothetical protein